MDKRSRNHARNNSVHVDAKKRVLKKSIPYEMQMAARFVLDEICYQANLHFIKEQIDDALDSGDREAFFTYSSLYKQYVKQ